MKLKKLVLVVAMYSACALASAGDIAYGTIDAIKVYDYSDSKVTKIYFSSDSTHQDETSCNKVAVITHSIHGDATEKMLSIALAGYMASRKVRAYSQTAGSCEVDLLSISDTYI